MADIKRLALMLKELDDQLVTCMRCGMCQAVCPVFNQTGRESDVTRGKLALLAGLKDQILTDSLGVKGMLDKCLLCGTCEANCPSGVKVTDIFLKARAILTAYVGMPPAQKLIFKKLLTNPKLMNNLVKLGASFQGFFTKEADQLIGTSCARFQSDLIGDRHFKTLAKKPLHSLVPSLDTPAGKSGLRVAFFPGCVTDKVYPGVGQAVLKILAHHGVGVYLPAGQACCGIPAISSGEREAFDEMLRLNLKVFGGAQFDYLLTPCATCTSTMKKLWPTMYSGHVEREAIAKLSAKVMDVTQFLADVLKIEPAGQNGGRKATYHDPCHLKNSLGVTKQPRDVLTANRAYSLVELPGGPSCCGCGGSFNIKFYETSSRIGKAKAQNVVASGAEVVATSCPACMMQLSDALSQEKAKVRVKHVVELYAESLA